MSYENETCAGCVWWCPLAYRCTNEEVAALAIGWSVGAAACPCFILSLECRKVRALETIARAARHTIQHAPANPLGPQRFGPDR